MKLKTLLALAAAALALAACKKSEPAPTPTPETTLSVSPTALQFAATGAPQEVTVTTNASSWSIKASADWITTEKKDGNNKFTVNVAENTGSAAREGSVTVTAGDKTETVKVAQDGSQPSAGSYIVITTNGQTEKIELIKKAEGAYEGTVNIAGPSSFYLEIDGDKYGFETQAGAGGLGDCDTTKFEQTKLSAFPVKMQNVNSKKIYHADRAMGNMVKDGNDFWINYTEPVTVNYAFDFNGTYRTGCICYALGKVEAATANLLYKSNFDLILSGGDYQCACKTFECPVLEDGTAWPVGVWRDNIENYTTPTFNASVWDGENASGGSTTQLTKEFVEGMGVNNWKGTVDSYFDFQVQCLHIGGSKKVAQVYTPEFGGNGTVEVSLDMMRMAAGTTSPINITIDGGGTIVSGETTVDYIEWGQGPATEKWVVPAEGETTHTLADNNYFSHTIKWNDLGAHGTTAASANNSVDKPISHFKFTIDGTTPSTRLFIETADGANGRIQIFGFKVVKK